jgi:hypothetical protein
MSVIYQLEDESGNITEFIYTYKYFTGDTQSTLTGGPIADYIGAPSSGVAKFNLNLSELITDKQTSEDEFNSLSLTEENSQINDDLFAFMSHY